MERTRFAALAALIVVLSVGGAALAAPGSRVLAELGAVEWPPATLLVSEVQTGGASASDEFAEITNIGSAAVDLASFELAYATSTGSTITRKASWASTLLLEPGRHLLVANAAGVYAPLADATYSGGLAAAGGAILIRHIGGSPIDAVGWGDATNGFVEGTAAPAPAAGTSLERKPGGIAGNTTDTNDNAADFMAQVGPNPQSLVAPPVPAPTVTPTPTPAVSTGPTPTASLATAPVSTPTPAPTSAPTSAGTSPTPGATPTATPQPTPAPTVTLEPSPTAAPTSSPSPEPTVISTPSPPVTPAPTAIPTASPTPTTMPVTSIVDARSLPPGTSVRLIGVLTTHLGALEDGRKAFIQDGTAGIALYLDVAVVDGLDADTLVEVTGTIDQRFAEVTLRANLVDLVAMGEQQRPPPWLLTTGEIGELVEGYRAIVQGTTVGAPTTLSDGLGLMVDDGSGAVRVIVGPDALGGRSVPSGTTVVAIGPVGQRDSSGTGAAGYRIHATEPSDFGIVSPPTPSPSVAPTPTPPATPTPTATAAPTPAPTSQPTPAPTPRPSPTPTATPRPSGTPSAAPTPVPTSTPRPSGTPGPTAPPALTILEARGPNVGTVVAVAGVVTAEAGRLGTPSLIAIADGTGGIVVRLPDGVAAPARGTTLRVQGPLADPYGQLEIRPSASGYAVTGLGSLPSPVRIAAAELGEVTEGRLAEITATVAGTPRKGTNGDLTIDLTDASGTAFRVLTDGSSGIQGGDLVKGRTYRLTGVVGQRASRKGALDGYRLHLRDRADIAAVASGGPGPSGSPASASPISTALALPEGSAVTVQATVTAGVALLDSSGRRIVIQDASGAVEVLLPSGASAPAVGTRLRIVGETGRAWGAPRIAAASVESLGSAEIAPTTLGRAPAERDEWLLVRITGAVTKVERLGDRWRAELVLTNGDRAPVHGQAGAEIPSTSIVPGRRITVVGIVRRPYPTASDRRFAVLPRSGADLALGPEANGAASGSAGGASGGNSGNDQSMSAGTVDVTPDTDLAALGERVGEEVRVGGLIASLADGGFDLDDGTALARIELRGGMAELLEHLRVGEAVAATGSVELADGAPVVIVDDGGTLVRVGSLGQALPIGDRQLALPASAAPDEADGLSTQAGSLGPDLPPTSLVALVALTILSIVATVLRRRLGRQRLRAALVARLATIRTGQTDA